MKNSVLAPIIALLLLLVVSWGGLFGLSHASAAADDPAPSRATPTAAPTPTADGRRDAQTSDDTTNRATMAAGSTPNDATADDRTGLDRVLDGFTGHDDATLTASASDASDSGDPDGLSNRGAAVLLLVIALIALANGRNK